jgi:hypothetical protein
VRPDVYLNNVLNSPGPYLTVNTPRLYYKDQPEHVTVCRQGVQCVSAETGGTHNDGCGPTGENAVGCEARLVPCGSACGSQRLADICCFLLQGVEVPCLPDYTSQAHLRLSVNPALARAVITRRLSTVCITRTATPAVPGRPAFC